MNAGAGWLDNDQENVTVGPAPGVPTGLTGTLIFDNNDDARFTGGGQIGYNYQIGSFVIGLETDIQWADTEDSINAAFVPGPGFAPGGTFVPGVFESNAPESDPDRVRRVELRVSEHQALPAWRPERSGSESMKRALARFGSWPFPNANGCRYAAKAKT